MAKPSKEKTLANVGVLIQQGVVTFNELQETYNANRPAGAEAVEERPATSGKSEMLAGTNDSHTVPEHNTSKTISNVLYVVGTLIICAGIYLLVAQNWDLLNTPVRVLVTFGLGLLVFLSAWYRARKQQQKDMNHDLLTSSLFTIGSVALSIGIGVIITEAGGDLAAPGMVTGAALGIMGAFLAFYLAVVRNIMVLTAAITLAVITYFAGVEWATYGQTKPDSFYYFETALAGALLVAGGLVARTRTVASQLAGVLYGVGIFAALGALFFLTIISGFNSDKGSASLIYDLLYPIFLTAGVCLSVYTRSRDVLVIVAIYLTGYIFEISTEYFAGFLGGSVALCLAGVLVMAMAYGATRFAKRYVTADSTDAK